MDDLAAVSAGVVSGQVPPASLALYARWWQLETWLRGLAYVELRAQRGVNWAENVHKLVGNRQEKDQLHTYMASPDLDNPLAYMDVSKLLELIEKKWELFAPTLLDRDVWNGRKAELLKIRNRIGHLHRPHSDDLSRLEQTLRDLEGGAQRAIRSYFDWHDACDLDPADPVVGSWIHGHHEDAERLVDHARTNYRTWLKLSYTVRPWSAAPAQDAVVSGTAGILWRADFIQQGRYLNVAALWNHLGKHTRRLLVHVVVADICHVAATFPAVEDGAEVADAIGDMFDSVISTSTRRYPGDIDDLDDEPLEREPSLDSRVQINTAWTRMDEVSMQPSIFCA